MNSNTAADSLAVAFGDFKRAYTILDHKSGTRVTVDAYTNRPYINYYTTRRVSGALVNDEAVKLLKFAAN